jgi:hypothetical protein
MDVYDELEQLVPQERKEDFLRLSRQLKEYGDHNPELLRIVEAMGFLSLYTEKLPERLNETIAHAQAQLITELKAVHAADVATMGTVNDELRTYIEALQEASQSLIFLGRQLNFPGLEKIKGATGGSAETEQSIATAVRNPGRRPIVVRRWHVLIITGFAILFFAAGGWFVWNDHRNIQKTIYEHVAARAQDAIQRLQPDYIKQHLENLKAFLDTGIHVSVERDSVSGDTVLCLEGTHGVSLYYPRCADGKYSINVLQ